jgi:hypothetical protein
MPDEWGKNKTIEIMRFLGTSERPVTAAEFSEMWKAMTEEEKEEFRTTPLPA